MVKIHIRRSIHRVRASTYPVKRPNLLNSGIDPDHVTAMKTTGRSRKSKVGAPIFDADGYQTNIKDINGSPLPDLGKVQAFSLWGGARKGAGRKSSGRQPVLLRLTPKTVRGLRAAARKQRKSVSDLAEERLAVV